MGAISNLQENENELAVKKVNKFLQLVSKSVAKKISKWISSPLLLFCLFSESATSSAVAHLLQGDTVTTPKQFYSNEHNTTIDIVAFFNFLKNNCPEENLKKVQKLDIISSSSTEITSIKNGVDMWDSAHKNLALGCLRNRFMHKFGGKGSNSQCSEQGVKEAGHCALGRRDEGTRSVVALAQGDTVKEVSIFYKNKKKEEEKVSNNNDNDNDGQKSIQAQNKEKSTANHHTSRFPRRKVERDL